MTDNLLGHVIRSRNVRGRWLVVEYENGWVPHIGCRRIHSDAKNVARYSGGTGANILGETYWSGCSPNEIVSARPMRPGEIVDIGGRSLDYLLEHSLTD